MADTSQKGTGREFHALIANIPQCYHSSDLRKYFFRFIETDGFSCFHFRHRPEGKNPVENGASTENVESASGISQSLSFGKNKYCQNQESLQKTKAVKSLKTCCIVMLKESKYLELVQLYHKKHWLDKKAQSMSTLCFISKIKVAPASESCETDAATLSGEDPQTMRGGQCLTETQLRKIPELNPPKMMPNGNVGTPSKVFLELIQQCMLPAKIIKNLGLSFPKSSSKAIYSNVTFDYGVMQSKNKTSHRKESLEPSISMTTDSSATANVKNQKSCHQEYQDTSQGTNGGKWRKHTQHSDYIDNRDRETHGTQSESEEDDDGCEEWERHEALWDDPTNVERNKERKYEEELEIVWEKGGPGLVWYTDEQFWRQKDGDFDEQTADDWDVDMSVYYEDNGGDKDARDMVSMRRATMRRKGYIEQDDPNISSGSANTIGKFEKHTKGVGRRVMEKQGWTDGSGLGPSTQGMAQALDNDGQKPMDKTGFGYRGEKVLRFGSKLRPKRLRRDADDVIISTVYDKPKDMELPETVLRRQEHKTMSYRHKVREWNPCAHRT